MPSARSAALLVPALALAWLALVHARRRRRLCASTTRSEPEPQAAPPDPRAASHLRFGNLCTRAGKLEKALEHYTSALKLRPNSAAAHHNSASVCQRLNRFDDAIRHYEARARTRPRASTAHGRADTPRTAARTTRSSPHAAISVARRAGRARHQASSRRGCDQPRGRAAQRQAPGRCGEPTRPDAHEPTRCPRIATPACPPVLTRCVRRSRATTVR